MPQVDAHAHVFLRSLPLAAQHRYLPACDAPVPAYLDHLDRNGLSHGVLVQPSFLGTDNSFMLDALAAADGRLRGIAVVEPGVSEAGLAAMGRQGVVGIRLNLIGKAAPDFREPGWAPLLAFVAAHDWHVEIHADAPQLPGVVAPLLEHEVRIVVDHFGRPRPEMGADDPGFRYLLSVADTGRVWVKASGAYRLGLDAPAVAGIAAHLAAAFGAQRLVWGSDWPHTMFEDRMDYETARRALDGWMPDPQVRAAMLGPAAARLFHIDMD